MNAYELFAAMDGIGDEILERSEIKRKSPRRYIRPSLIAACCVLVLSVLYAQLRYGILHPEPQVDPTQDTTADPMQVVDTPYYNDARYEYPQFDDTSYYSLYEVTHQQINAILPQPCPQWMAFEGEAMFGVDGRARTVIVGSLTSVEGTELALYLGTCDVGVRIKGEPVAYRCGQAEFLMSQTKDGDTEAYWILTARAEINATPVYVEMYASEEVLGAAKAVFEETLQWLGACAEDDLDLEKFSIDSDPWIWYLPYSREQFEQESGYGPLLPEEDPQVYSDMQIEWEKLDSGVSEKIAVDCYQGEKLVLEWNINFDLMMPGVYDRELLSDRSTYIKAQELTPEAVERIVKANTTLLGQSVFHAVDYERFILYVSARDVSAQWLYDQLIRIRDMQKDLSVYLPTGSYSETSRMFTETVFHGGLLNEMCVSVMEDQGRVLSWTVMDEELNQTTDNLIRAQDLTLGIMETYISAQGVGSIQVYFDDVVVAIESNGADVQWIYDQLIAVRERVGLNALKEFQEILHKPDLEGLTMKIWYTSPDIDTRFPWGAEDLKKYGELISADTQTLLDYVEYLKLLDPSLLLPSDAGDYVNARMCMEFETGDGETVLQILINGLHDSVFINGVQVECDSGIFDVIAPFAPKELRELWLLDQLSTGSVE